MLIVLYHDYVKDVLEARLRVKVPQYLWLIAYKTPEGRMECS